MHQPKVLLCYKWTLVLLYLFTFLQHSCHGSAIGDKIEQQLTKFADDSLGVKEFQDHLDNNINFQNVNLDPTHLAKQVAEAMSEKLKVRIDALTGLRDDIENVYSGITQSNPYNHCCNVAVYEKDTLLNTQVNYNEWCTVGQQLSKAKEFLPNTIQQKVKDQYNKALGIKYAYFGSWEGVMFNYPAVRFCDNQYDPRFRPWYVEASTPKPKDLVIVIDKSGSMNDKDPSSGQTLMQIAKNAATTVVGTLNPNDRVGIVAFSSAAYVPSGNTQTSTCYNTVLAKATSQNKEYLLSYINGLSAGGSTFYNKAMTTAFKYFGATPSDVNDTRNRDKVILFLTDGQPSEGSSSYTYTSLIAAENAKLGNNITILTYGLGSNVIDSILTDMAEQTASNSSYGEIKKGTYTHVSNPTNLRSDMASYYEQFKTVGVPKAIFTVPYIDAFGSGLLISLCLPVNYQNTLKGVTCMDLSVDDMLSEITYFREGESSYGFIIDATSRVLTHPLIAFASEVTNNPKFIYLKTLETVSGINEITQSMTIGDNGTKITGSQRIIPRGNVQLEGIRKTTSASTYSWYPVSGTDFSICLVIKQGDQKASILVTPPHPDYLYHRLDLGGAQYTKCNQFDRVSVKDHSSLTFAARSFIDPFKYLNTNEDKNKLDQYQTYLKGSSQLNPGFKEDVRETVAATADFENIMLKRTEYGLYSVWRYASTDNGIHRIFPAVEIPKNYDATRRSWYLRAKANTGKITVSTPYVDAFGAGIVVTLSKTLFEGNKQGSHTATDKTIGVMGVDFTLQYFYYDTIALTPQCQTHTCFIVDNAGFIAVHKEWIVSAKSIPELTNVHISKFEPSIATELLDSNIVSFNNDGCVNIEELRDQYFWDLSSTNDVVTNNYELHRIPNTNVFLVIRKADNKNYKTGQCQNCGTTYGACAYRFKDNGCFCPCYKSANVYKYCEGVFDFSGDTLQPCTPALPVINFSAVNTKDEVLSRSLQKCYNYNCEAKTNSSSCSSVITCSWCQYDAQGEEMTPYCSTDQVCPFGSLQNAEATEGGGSAPWWIALIVLAILVAGVGGIIYWYKKKQWNKHSKRSATNDRPAATSNRPPPTNPTAATTSSIQASAPVFSNMGYDPGNPQHVAPPAYGDVYPDSIHYHS